MCLICVEFQLSKLTLEQASRHFGEMRSNMSEEHAEEVEEMLEEARVKKEIDKMAELGRD